MANENKNAHELASESDEDTSELEVLPETLAQDAGVDYESESDAATHSFEDLERQREFASLATLRRELHERDGEIGRLEYEVEQVRARCLGLEAELKAREDLTGNLATELTEVRKTLAGARERLQRRDERLARLETDVREREDRLSASTRALEETRQSAEAAEAARAELERRWQEASATIASLTADLEHARTERLQAIERERSEARRRTELEQQQAEARSTLETLRQYIEGRKAQWEQQEVLLRTKDALLEEQHRKIRQYADESEDRGRQLRDARAAAEAAHSRQTGLERENARLREEQEALERLLAEREPSLEAERERAAELSARLDELEDELGAATSAREQAEATLSARDRELESLQGELDRLRIAGEEREVLAAELGEVTAKLAAARAAHGELDAQRAALREELSSLVTANEALKADLGEHEEAAALRLAEIDSLAVEVAELASEHARERRERESLEAQCNALAGQAERLQQELDAARASAGAAHALAEERDRLSGLLAGQRDELRVLREQLAKTEAYADSLRRKVAGRAAEAEAKEARRRDLEAALSAARGQIAGLTTELDSVRAQLDEAAAGRQDDQRRFDEELKQLRLDLTRAEATITESQTLNEQLASDLVETSSFRVALESQLSAADEGHRKQLKELQRELKKLRQQVEDYEHKIASKDAAIAVLLAELAAKPQRPAEGEPEPVVHRLAERKTPPAPEERPAPSGEKDRTARLLIGAVDGQEVRFPLFKNKLTIGRTANNDIQLKAQYISRRHAVVVCDNDSTRIVDWGSKNGIYVNGIRVSEKILKNGDKVTVGTAEFRFEERPKR